MRTVIGVVHLKYELIFSQVMKASDEPLGDTNTLTRGKVFAGMSKEGIL